MGVVGWLAQMALWKGAGLVACLVAQAGLGFPGARCRAARRAAKGGRA